MVIIFGTYLRFVKIYFHFVIINKQLHVDLLFIWPPFENN